MQSAFKYIQTYSDHKGTEDIAVPAANSIILTQKIPGAWLVQIKDAGHGLMCQYPDKFNKVLQTFLLTTTTTIPS